MKESSGVHEFVHYYSWRPTYDASIIETNFLRTSIDHADVAVASFYS
jgi:hypothetical protein